VSWAEQANRSWFGSVVAAVVLGLVVHGGQLDARECSSQPGWFDAHPLEELSLRRGDGPRGTPEAQPPMVNPHHVVELNRRE
jgi:hypothetical protein